MKKDKWEIYKSLRLKENGYLIAEWRWTRKASNGRIVGASCEGYRKKSTCIKNAVRNGYITLGLMFKKLNSD